MVRSCPPSRPKGVHTPHLDLARRIRRRDREPTPSPIPRPPRKRAGRSPRGIRDGGGVHRGIGGVAGGAAAATIATTAAAVSFLRQFRHRRGLALRNRRPLTLAIFKSNTGTNADITGQDLLPQRSAHARNIPPAGHEPFGMGIPREDAAPEHGRDDHARHGEHGRFPRGQRPETHGVEQNGDTEPRDGPDEERVREGIVDREGEETKVSPFDAVEVVRLVREKKKSVDVDSDIGIRNQ